MGIFKKNGGKLRLEAPGLAEKPLREAIAETQELYEDIRADYNGMENLISEFESFILNLKPVLEPEDAVRLQEFFNRLVKVDKVARNSVRDLRDIIRNQKKMLNEVIREKK